MSALSSRQRGLLGIILLLTIASGAMHYADVAPVPTFVVSAAALAGLAWVVSFATEQVGERFGPEITGVLQSTLGNLPEFFVVLFALNKGEVVVAQFSIIGSIFANALLVLGIVIVIGAHRSSDGVMRFHTKLPNDTATLLLLTSFIIVLVGVVNESHDKAAKHIDDISVIVSIFLLVVYAVWVWGYLRSGKKEAAAAEQEPGAEPVLVTPGHDQPEPEPAHHEVMPLGVSLALLAIAGVGAALVSDWFIDALAPTIDQIGVSEQFAGLVIVAIAGNAVENFAGLVLAWKQENDFAISIVKNSVAQIAAFLFPLLVLASLFFSTHLTYGLGPVYVAALFLTAISIWQVTTDGEATPFEGWALIATYLVLATLTLYE